MFQVAKPDHAFFWRDGGSVAATMALGQMVEAAMKDGQAWIWILVGVAVVGSIFQRPGNKAPLANRLVDDGIKCQWRNGKPLMDEASIEPLGVPLTLVQAKMELRQWISRAQKLSLKNTQSRRYVSGLVNTFSQDVKDYEARLTAALSAAKDGGDAVTLAQLKAARDAFKADKRAYLIDWTNTMYHGERWRDLV